MESNKAIIREFLAALGTGDGERLKTLMTSDAVAICTGTCVLSGTRDYATICATAGLLKSATRNGIDFQILNLTAEGDRVAAEVEGRSVLANGTPYDNEYHFLFFLRGGKICRIKEYLDTKLAETALAPLLAQA